MAANYPSSLPVKDAAGANLSTNPHSALHDDMYDEIVAIGTELGTNPKGTAASVKARLDLVDIGAWTSHTPVMTQGVSLTTPVNYSKYQRVGRKIIWNFRVQSNTAGTASTSLSVALPVTGLTNGVFGHGMIDDGTTLTLGMWVGNSTAAAFRGHGRATSDPAPQIGISDDIYGQIIYEAAS